MTCATEPCDRVERCVLVGGCIVRRCPQTQRSLVARDLSLRDDAPKLNGAKARAVRDPMFIKRKRKMLTP